jgi:hypothetical protein
MATSWFDPNLLPLLELHTDDFRWMPEVRLFAAKTSALLLPGKPLTMIPTAVAIHDQAVLPPSKTK